MLILLRRHYGKLAAGLLLALALAALWWALPVRPRIAWRVPEVCAIVGFSADGKTLATQIESRKLLDYQKVLRLWEVQTGRQRAALGKDVLGTVECEVSLSPDGRHLAIWDLLGPAKVFEVESGEVWSLPAAMARDRSLPPVGVYSPDNTLLAYVGAESREQTCTVQLWDTRRRQTRALLGSPQADLVVFSPDSKWLATANATAEKRLSPVTDVTIWETATGRKYGRFTVSDGSLDLEAVAFSADSKTFGIACRYDTIDYGMRIMLWDLASKRLLESREECAELTSTAPETPLEHRYCMASAKRNLRLLDFQTGREKSVLTNFFDPEDTAVSAKVIEGGDHLRDWEAASDGRTLAVLRWRQSESQAWWEWLEAVYAFVGLEQSQDTSLELWDINTGRRTARLSCRDDVAMSPDGMLVAVRPDDHNIQIWDLPPRRPLGWFLGLAGVLVLLTLGGFWWQARRRKRKAAAMSEAIPCGTC